MQGEGAGGGSSPRPPCTGGCTPSQAPPSPLSQTPLSPASHNKPHFPLSALYAAEAVRALAATHQTYGTSAFVAVHVRVEEDWKRVCASGADRTARGHWLSGSDQECLVPDTAIAAHLAAAGVPKGALAFVMSAAPLAAMPALCGPGGALACFTPDEVWTAPSDAVPLNRTLLPRAYVSYLLAQHATKARERVVWVGKGEGGCWARPPARRPGPTLTPHRPFFSFPT